MMYMRKYYLKPIKTSYDSRQIYMNIQSRREKKVLSLCILGSYPIKTPDLQDVTQMSKKKTNDSFISNNPRWTVTETRPVDSSDVGYVKSLSHMYTLVLVTHAYVKMQNIIQVFLKIQSLWSDRTHWITIKTSTGSQLWTLRSAFVASQ